MKCEAGTYIRKLVHDIGQAIGCGAHMTELRRTEIGPFSIRESVPLQNVSEKDVVPIEKILERVGLKKIIVKDGAISKIMNGNPVFSENMEKSDNIIENEFAGIYSMKGEIIAIGKKSGEKIKVDRVFL